METIEPFILKALLQNGFTQETIQAKTPQELREIYKKGVAKYIQGFSPEKKIPIHQKIDPFKNLTKIEDVYTLSLDFCKHFSGEDIALMMNKRFKNIPIDQIQKITQILLHMAQEEILQSIVKKLEKIPQEEKDTLFEIYELQKNDIHHLVRISQKLDLPQFRKNLEEILRIKTSIAHQRKETTPS